jgi:hypothetical protein
MQNPIRVLALAAVFAAAAAAPALAAATWSCSNGQRYTAVYDNDRLVLSGPGVRYTLLPRRAASGVLYRRGGIRFHEKGRNAVMSFPGGGRVTCTRARTAARRCPPRQEWVNGRCRRNDEMDPNQPCGPGFRMGPNGRCVSQAQNPGSTAALPAPGKSYGGIVRAGPSRSSARLGALPEGERVMILADTGVTWNDYNWFRIRFRGRVGYQWGGILCARRAPIPGVYKVCP